MTAKTIATILATIFIGCVIVFIPFAFIWSLNSLFPLLCIPYNAKTWLASMLLFSLFSSPLIKATTARAQ